MAQSELGYQGVERRRAPRVVANQAALSAGFALFEGTLAGLVMLLPALAYLVLVRQIPVAELPFPLYAGFSAVVGVFYGGFSAAAASQFLDRAQHPHSRLAHSVLGWTGAFAIALFLAFLFGAAGQLSRVSLLAGYGLGVPVLLFARIIAYARVLTRIRAGRLQFQKVAVVGNRTDAVRFLVNGSLWKTGYRLAGTLYLEDALDPEGAVSEGAIIAFARDCVARGAEFIVFVGEIGDLDGLEKVTNELKRFAINVVCVPATNNVSFKFLDVVPIGPNNALRSLRKPMGDRAVLTKRAFDLVGAGFGLVFLSPLLLVVAVLIKLDSPGPVFYRQARRGFNGAPFHIWKFRSMRVTESGTAMTQAQAGDKRITRIGRFLRRYSIDELPQLINVLGGEMSLVGPRPHALVHDDELGEQLASYAHRQRIKPGISGWAQVNGYRGVTSTFEQIEGRTRHDLYYIDNWSVFLDCWIIVLTVFSARTRQNAL